MDGWLDAVGGYWRSPRDVAAPLARNEGGELLCPLCSRNKIAEVLRQVVGSRLKGCSRGHRFEPEPQG